MVSDAVTLRELADRAASIEGKRYEDRPIWWDAFPTRSAARLPTHADVVIVGAGFTGLSAALTLSRAGRLVVVLEAGPLGYGASARNGGQVGSGNQKFSVKNLIALRGERLATALLREGVAMLDYIESLVESEKIDCHFRRSGRFRGAVHPEHYESMARDMEDLRRCAGVESFAVPRSEQHREIGSDFFHGGSVLPHDGEIHPGKYHAGLVDSVTESGGVIVDRHPVVGIRSEGNGFTVETEHSKIYARDVIVATNGYTTGLVPWLGRRIVPVQSAIITTRKAPEALLDALMPTRRMYGNTNRAFSYFRVIPDHGGILWGGRVGRLEKKLSAGAYAHLARDLLRVFPSAGDLTVERAWSGNIGYTFDSMPHLGRNPDGIHYAMGYCGTGVSRSTFFGNKIGLKVLDHRDGATPFDEISFPTHPFHFFAKSAVPIVETTYRLRDYFNI